MMKSDNVTVYRLKEDWEPFDKGAEFTYDEDGIYMLKANDKVMAEIPVDLLEVVRNKRWKPDRKDVYYHLYSGGNIGSTMFFPGGDGDEGRLAIGNYFKTEEEALSMVEWLKARQTLIDSGAEFMNTVDVDDEDVAYYGVAFDKIRGKLHTIKCYSVGDDVFDKRLYFLNEDVAEKSIEDYRDDWLTYLGVKGSDED
jgi:hypothetical protein|nr:MAG TPA: hypothetical protein [Caudoviricetes sp.]